MSLYLHTHFFSIQLYTYATKAYSHAHTHYITKFNSQAEILHNLLNNNKGYNLRQRARLKFAQFNEQCCVHHINMRGCWKLEQLCKDHLQNKPVSLTQNKGYLCTATTEKVLFLNSNLTAFVMKKE